MVSARTAEALIGAVVKPFRGEGRRTIAAAVAAAISVVWDKLNKEKGLVQNSGKQWVRRPDSRAALHQATAQQSAGKTERKRRRRQKLKQKKREKLEANRRADGGGDEVQPMEVSSTGVTMATAAAAASGSVLRRLGSGYRRWRLARPVCEQSTYPARYMWREFRASGINGHV